MSQTHTVLIVDDSFEDRFILKRYLDKTGLSLVILEAGSGAKAIELLTTPAEELSVEYPAVGAPVTLFLDINMPLMNGWEFLEEMDRRHADIQLHPTVVLMYSTSDYKEDRSKALNYSTVANYIVKGESNPEVLKDAILSICT